MLHFTHPTVFSGHKANWLKPVLALLLLCLSWTVQAQTITSFTPTTGTTGTTVNITGTGFTNVSAVNFNGIGAAFFVSSSTSIISQVPAGATTGKIQVVTQSGTATSVADFVIGAPVPSITSFSPGSGAVGINVSITGQNFTGVDSVLFNGRRSQNVTVNSSTNVQAEVPVGATTGPISIYTTSGSTSSSTSFIVTGGAGMRITGFSPTQGPVGTTVTLFGTGLGLVNQASINAIGCPVISVASTQVSIQIPSGATTGPIQLFDGSSGAQTATNFIVTGATGLCFPNPTASSITPTSIFSTRLLAAGTAYAMSFTASVGTTYTFGTCNTSNDTYIRIYDNSGTLVAENDDNGPLCTGSSASIIWQPTASGTYRVLVTNYSCNALATDVLFNFRAGAGSGVPTVVNFSPPNGPVGTTVTVTGTNLNQINSVTINGAAGTNLVATTSQLTFRVGAGSTTAPIALRYGAGTVQTSTAFVVDAPCINQAVNFGSLSPTPAIQNVNLPAGSVYGFTVVLPAGREIMLSTCPTNANTRIVVYSTTSGVEYASYDDNGPYCTGVAASGRFTAPFTDTYSVIVAQSTCSPLAQTTSFQYRFEGAPLLTNLTPTSGPIASQATLTGVNLDYVTSVLINGTPQTITSQTNSQIGIRIATGTTTGQVALVYANGTVNTSFIFTVTGALGITTCNASAVNRGSLTIPIGSANFVNSSSGTAPYWSFSALAGWQYVFNTCGNGVDTKLRIYNSAGTEILAVDDNGPRCTGSDASMHFEPTTNGTYYVLLTNYDCNLLSSSISMGYFRTSLVPTITGFTPTSGPVGTAVSVSGTNLDRVTGVTLNTTLGGITSQSASLLTFNVPTGATTGRIILTYGGTSTVSSATNFTVTQPAAITTCDPTAVAGANLNITTTQQTVLAPVGPSRFYRFTATAGTTYNFSTCGSSQDTYLRIYDGTSALLAVNDDDGPLCNPSRSASLQFTPTTSGNYYVHVADYSCNPLSQNTNLTYYATNTARVPSISSFTPSSGPVGTLVSVSGTNMDVVTSASIGGVAVSNFSVVGTTQVFFNVAPSTTTNTITLNYLGGSVQTSTSFVVTTVTPSYCLTPNSFTPITPNTIAQGFNLPVGSAPVFTFSGTAGTTYRFSTCNTVSTTLDTKIRIYSLSSGVEVASADDNGIACTGNKASIDFVPSSTGSYAVLVTKYDCQFLDEAANFTYQVLNAATISIRTFTPTSGFVGDAVTIYGRGFTGTTDIYFNGGALRANVTGNINDTTLVTLVPAGAVTGNICVRSPQGYVCSTTPFTLLTLPATCSSNLTNGGTLNVTSTLQNLQLPAGRSYIYKVDFVAGNTYQFSTCNSTGTNDTYIRIYNTAGAVVTENNDNGPLCTGTKASLQFNVTGSGVAFVHVSNNSCLSLSQTSVLSYRLLGPAPVITSFSPASGPVGTRVTVTGTNLSDITSVRINGVAGTAVSVLSSTQFAFTVAAGTTTGFIQATDAANRSALSNTQFTVTNPCALSFTLRPSATPNALNATVLNSTGAVTYTLGSTVLSGTGTSNTIALPSSGRYVLEVRDANGCSASRAFVWNAGIACDTRFQSNSSDSLFFFRMDGTASANNLIMFDRGSAYTGTMYVGGVLRTRTTTANRTSLQYTAGASAGANVLEVLAPNRADWAAYSICQPAITSAVAVNSGTVSSCTAGISHLGFPGRATYAANQTITEVLRPATVGQRVVLTIRALKLENGQRLRIFSGSNTSGVPLITLQGEYSFLVPPTATSTSADGSLTLEYVGSASTEAAGFYLTTSCTANPTPRIVQTTAANVDACTGGRFTATASLLGNITLPVLTQLQLSDNLGSFVFPLTLSSANATTTSVVTNVALPGAIQPGTYKVRYFLPTLNLISDTVTLTVGATPVASFVQSNDTLYAQPANAGSYQWFYNNSAIPGATQNFLKAGFNGNYSVRIANGDCADTSAVRVINSLVDGSSSAWQVYPNPAHSHLNIDGWYGAATQAVLYNALGQKVLEMPLAPDTRITMPLAGISAGSYYVEVGGVRKRIVVQ